MLEQLLIFTRGGLILWTCKELGNALRGSPIDTLIRSCLLEERSGASSYNYDAPGAAYTLKWTFHNELGLIFVAVYQRILHLLYVDDLLAMVKKEFSEIYDPKRTVYNDFDDKFRQLRKEAEARAEEMKNSNQVGLAKKQGKVQQTCLEGGNKKKSSGDSGNDGGDGEKSKGRKSENCLANGNCAGNVEVTARGTVNGKENGGSNTVAFDVNKLKKLGGKNAKKTDTVVNKVPKVESKKKITKKNRVWDEAPPKSGHISQFLSLKPHPLSLSRIQMPFCEVGKYQSGVDASGNNGIKIFYRTYGRGPVKVLMIIGLAGTHDSWGPQIKGLTGTLTPNDHDWAETDRSSAEDEHSVCNEGHIEVCALDNRGMGRSSVPKRRSEYTTRVMAKDAIAVMDHLGWGQAHVFGHSMGAMISCKLASMVPDRVQSLALLNVTGGGFECFPKLDRQTFSIAIRFLKAKTPEQRAAVDLDTHYTKEYLEELVGSKTRRSILYQEYVKGISATGMQSNYGFDGQINACWTHKMSRMELELIHSSKFLISVIHGRDDVIAQLRHARRLAERLYPFARMVELHGGHLVSHERTAEVNEALLELIRASESEIDPLEWTNLPQPSPGWIVTRISLYKRNPEGGSNTNLIFGIVEKLYLFLLYLFGLLVLAFEHIRRAIRSLKPVKVEAVLT